MDKYHYYIASSSTLVGLQEQVNAKFIEGYTLYGHICTTEIPTPSTIVNGQKMLIFYQPMFLDKEKFEIFKKEYAENAAAKEFNTKFENMLARQRENNNNN